MVLEQLGADPCVYGAFKQYREQNLTLARVATAQRDHYQLLTEAGQVSAGPPGRLYLSSANRAGLPVTGDWVAARLVEPDHALVEAVLPRRSCLSRRAAGRREDEQALAANVDVVFIVCGLDGDYNVRRIERYLAIAAGGGVEPVVVLNKADLCTDLRGREAGARKVAGNAPVVVVSALSSEGLEGLAAFMGPGRTVALLGSSGAGKSSIANRLMEDGRLRTGEVRSWDSRGRHTTVRRELIALPQGGAIIDTPGLRELQLWVDAGSVDSVFEEIAGLAEGCRFRDCSHTGEPGCAVAEALEAGQLEQERVESYRKLRAEAEWHESLANPLSAGDRKRKWKTISRQIRAMKERRR